jgi:hypothetical protein
MSGLAFHLTGERAEQSVRDFRGVGEQRPDLEPFQTLTQHTISLNFAVFDKGETSTGLGRGCGPEFQELCSLIREKLPVVVPERTETGPGQAV